MKNWTKLAVSGTAVVALIGLAGCASGDAEGAATVDNGDEQDITLSVFNSWEEGIAVSELWKLVLEDEGYNVELAYADPAPLYLGLTEGDYDALLSSWQPNTHRSYMEEYGDRMVDLGPWNEDAKLTIAVNEDAPIDSLEELAENADLFDNRLIGIEPGAGLTEITTEEVIPTYGLDDMDHVISSTPAMIAEIRRATERGDNIAVTLWRPHWAYDAFPIKDLEDPEGALGETETMNSFGSLELEETHPTISRWLSEWEMSSDLLYSLENVMFNENDTNDYEPIVREWMDDNPEFVEGLTD